MELLHIAESKEGKNKIIFQNITVEKSTNRNHEAFREGI